MWPSLDMLVDVTAWWHFAVMMFVAVAMAAAIILIGSLIIAIPGLIVDLLILRPGAWFLERRNASRHVRVFVLFTLVTGFVLELLAS